MKHPNILYYATPLFHARQEDKNLLERIDSGEADTHSHQLFYAMTQLRPEAYFTASDRDARLGKACVPVCRYVAATAEQVEQSLSATGWRLACGYPLGHARYGEMIDRLLPDTLRALIEDRESRKDLGMYVADAEIVIDRVTYVLELREQRTGGLLSLDFNVLPWMGARSQEQVNATGDDLLERVRGMFTGFYGDRMVRTSDRLQ